MNNEDDKEYKKVRIVLSFINTILLGIGVGLYVYDRKKCNYKINE